jgi:hypothetical protein
MARVPIDADPRQRAWRQQLEYVGLPYTTPMPVPRASPGVGIGPAISGHEVNPPPRPRPPVEHMRSETPRRMPTSLGQRIWPRR